MIPFISIERRLTVAMVRIAIEITLSEQTVVAAIHALDSAIQIAALLVALNIG